MRRAALAALAVASSGCLDGTIAAPIESLLGPDAPALPAAPNKPAQPGTPVDLCVSPDPGRPTIHRLNRAEYDNTIRDLLDEDMRPGADLPPDDHGFGFDNNADVLSTSPLLFEKYEAASATLVARALERSDVQIDRRFEAEVVGSDAGAAAEDYWNLYVNGEITATVQIATAGEYTISVRVAGQRAGGDLPRMELRVDNRMVQGFDVAATESSPATLSARRMLGAGQHTVTVAFVNDFYDAASSADRNLLVDWLSVQGPRGVSGPDPAKRARIMVCDPAASTPELCARQIFSAFGRRAWRRPLTADELDRLVALAKVAWDESDPFDVGIGLGLQGILLSPSFAFRVELDPSLTDTTPHAVDDHALAARLSYFLWSSMPDQALFDRADRGQLSQPDVLAAEVRRMLRDPKAQALTDNFAGQWLYTRALGSVSPDRSLYPDWNAELARSMRAETEAFFSTFLTADASALDMLDADFSYLDDRLAAHYGVAAPGSTTPQRVALAGSERRGLFSQASILTVTSHARRTSPVKRGKWVLENILCSAPPAPPPGVEGIPEVVNPQASLRDRFEAHRSQDRCKSCHATMDPIGFSLEHFDAIGKWREKDGAFDIDDTAELPDGTRWEGPTGLAAQIKSDPRASHCMTEKLFIYALGRGPTDHDRACNIPQLDRQFAEGGHRLEHLVTRLVQSPAFTQRRAEGN